MLPAIDSGDDAVWFGGPDEGFGIVVGLGDEAVDGDMQVVDGAKDTAFQPPAGELGKEAFNCVQPGCRGRRKVERPARMAFEPGLHFRMFVGRIVVENCVDYFAGWPILGTWRARSH